MPDTLTVLPENAFQPLFVSSLGDDAVDLAAVTGLFLDDWQQEVVKTSLTFKGDLDSKFAARQMLLLVPRQQGKNSCLEARELAALFLLHEPVIGHTAHEFRTAQSSFKRLRERIEFAAEVLNPDDAIRFRNSGAETSILVPGDRAKGVSDSYIVFTPRTPGALRGLSVDLLILDEAYALTADHVSALRPTQNAVKRAQLWATSSTGFPDSMELMAMREQGLNRVENMGFFEWKADDGSDPGDRDQWFKALPGLRTGRQDIDEIVLAYEHAKSTGDYTDFNREYLGLWATNDIGALISPALWQSLKYEDGYKPPLPDKFAFAIDVDPQSNGASIFAVGQDSNGFFFPWRAAHDDGVLWVAEWLKIQQEQRPGHYVTVFDGQAPVGQLKSQFDDLGVEYVELGAAQCIQACSKFETFVRDGRIKHGDDPLLTDAVNNGVKRLIGAKGAWLWSPKIQGAEIRPLVAATYALFGLTAVEPPEKRSGDFWW